MSSLFVIDNSVIMTWCFQDEADPYADAVLDKLITAKAIVPSIWPLEVVNVLLVAEHRWRLRQTDSVRFLALLAQLPITVEHERIEKRMGEILALGRATHLSSYDAAYLELSMRLGLPIATLDQKLLAAAQQVAVPLFDI
ncbi:MAG: type II toxin-antitoxin system VapC family toxin [Ardenticatenales bacterium]|nr:type II toxin-antitoxin system VapC family toxin [Ardenticatenales bacterium]